MTNWITDDDDIKWATDDKGNKCSVGYFGSEKLAEKALDSLIDCDNCTNCSRCSGCSACSRCSGCSDCSRCSGCSACSRCSGCSDCSDCSRCSGCSRCSACSDCSGCSGCSGCSDCRNIVWLDNKEGIKVDPDNQDSFTGPLPVPKIENIHQRVYEAVTQPNAFDMSTWHTCETTHCRGGWVVTLAGAEGKALEAFFNTELAAMKIYEASGYLINPCRFYDTNADSLADMKKLAEAA